MAPIRCRGSAGILLVACLVAVAITFLVTFSLQVTGGHYDAQPGSERLQNESASSDHYTAAIEGEAHGLSHRGYGIVEDEVWYTAQDRGKLMICMLREPVNKVSLLESEFQDYHDFARYGWTIDDLHSDLPNVLKGLPQGLTQPWPRGIGWVLGNANALRDLVNRFPSTETYTPTIHNGMGDGPIPSAVPYMVGISRMR